ncbi:PIN domain-containing protein [Paracoccus sp. S-4012]|uniref:type II toxin-antitoxin system VapC family toxin n=1 Tax=Paracoccus sp. S-4012 TaxID=2665648 RepID=UPI0012AF9754|nr:type II toxin-antitoxin system VapC family toxin [Paracoccus sp. S-4012]MRX50757.1 PIN domain-containing protein [Paracoccus sp. S-4012]
MSSATLIVIDASVAIKWLVDEDGSDAALALQGRDLAAPALLRIEAANVLRTLVARRAATRDEARDLFALLQDAPVTIVDHDDALEGRALDLALDLGHPVYDCVYLALAERMDRCLVTADGRFLGALRSTPHASRAVALEAAVS